MEYFSRFLAETRLPFRRGEFGNDSCKATYDALFKEPYKKEVVL